MDEYSDDSNAESEKVRKAKKSKIPANVKWSGSLICNLVDEYEARPSCITVTKIVATAALLSSYKAIFVTKFKAPPYLFAIARSRRLGTS